MSKDKHVVYDGSVINLDKLTIGTVFGRGKRVEECPKCKAPGVRWKRTIFAHAILYLQRRSGSEYVEIKRQCKVESPPKVEDVHAQSGFSYCPKDLL